MKRGLYILVLFALFAGCDKNDNFVVFSTENDVQLGQQVQAEIANDPSIKILPDSQYPEVYNFLYHVRDGILSSGKVAYKDEFAWEVYVIDDDQTLNAFATPGGYIYVYTGLIKYLDHAPEYACNGAAYFFTKITASGEGGQPPEFLSTHPNPENRVDNINSKAQAIGCDTSLATNTQYDAVKASLDGGV